MEETTTVVIKRGFPWYRDFCERLRNPDPAAKPIDLVVMYLGEEELRDLFAMLTPTSRVRRLELRLCRLDGLPDGVIEGLCQSFLVPNTYLRDFGGESCPTTGNYCAWTRCINAFSLNPHAQWKSMAIPLLPKSVTTDILVRFLRTNKVDCLSFEGGEDGSYAHMEEELRGINVVVRKLVLSGYSPLEFKVALCRALRGNVHLRKISVSSCCARISSEVRALCDLVSSCPHMTEFPEFTDFPEWSPENITDMAESLPEGAPYESLAFEGGLGSAHVAPLLELIRKLPRLKKLNLSHARLAGADFAALCDGIIPGGMLEKFDILENDGPGAAVAGVALKNLIIRNCGPNSLGIRVDPSFFGMVHLPRSIDGEAVASQGRCFWDCDMWDQLARNTSVSDLDMMGSSGDVANYCRALGPVPTYLDMSFCGPSITSEREELTIEVRTEVTSDVQPFWRKVRFTMTGTAIDLLVTMLESDISALRGLSLTGSKEKLRLADLNNCFPWANNNNFFARNIPAQVFQQLGDTLKKNTSIYEFKISNASHRLRCLSLEFFPLRNRIESLSSVRPSFLPLVMVHSPDAELRRNAIFLCLKKYAGNIREGKEGSKKRKRIGMEAPAGH